MGSNKFKWIRNMLTVYLPRRTTSTNIWRNLLEEEEEEESERERGGESEDEYWLGCHPVILYIIHYHNKMVMPMFQCTHIWCKNVRNWKMDEHQRGNSYLNIYIWVLLCICYYQIHRIDLTTENLCAFDGRCWCCRCCCWCWCCFESQFSHKLHAETNRYIHIPYMLLNFSYQVEKQR